ncbi:hypothetical protein [Rhodoflexus sp.]
MNKANGGFSVKSASRCCRSFLVNLKYNYPSKINLFHCIFIIIFSIKIFICILHPIISRFIKMKYIKNTYILFVAILLVSCGGSATTESGSERNQESIIVEKPKPDEVVLKDFSKEDVARYAIAAIMGRPPKTMFVRFEDDIYYVSYVRKDDGKKFEYKIKMKGHRIIWGDIYGRWRELKEDEKIYFEEIEGKLKITERFSDGSVNVKEYNKGE